MLATDRLESRLGQELPPIRGASTRGRRLPESADLCVIGERNLKVSRQYHETELRPRQAEFYRIVEKIGAHAGPVERGLPSTPLSSPNLNVSH